MQASTIMWRMFDCARRPAHRQPTPPVAQLAHTVRLQCRHGGADDGCLHPMHVVGEVQRFRGGDGKDIRVKFWSMMITKVRRFSSLKLSLKAVAPIQLAELLLASLIANCTCIGSAPITCLCSCTALPICWSADLYFLV